MTTITLHDFMSGVIWGCAVREVRSFPYQTPEFYHAIKDAFDTARNYAEQTGADLRFLVILDEMYGDSPVIDEAIAAAVQSRMLTLDPIDHTAYITDSHDQARLLLKRLPGGTQAYTAFADAFLSGLR